MKNLIIGFQRKYLNVKKYILLSKSSCEKKKVGKNEVHFYFATEIKCSIIYICLLACLLVYLLLLLAECALLGDYQRRIKSMKTQYFISSWSVVQ